MVAATNGQTVSFPLARFAAALHEVFVAGALVSAAGLVATFCRPHLEFGKAVALQPKTASHTATTAWFNAGSISAGRRRDTRRASKGAPR